MSHSIFFIPGYHGSGPDHWQSWLQSRLADSSTLRDVDWESPDITAWTDQAHRQIAAVGKPVLIVAHSFGCLVAATVAAEKPGSIAGIVFVAPADARRFAASGGLRNTRFDGTSGQITSVADILPETLPYSVKSAMIGSENDPWLSFSNVLAIKQRWRSHFVDLGEVGHINGESGFGAWPALLRELHSLRKQAVPDFSTLHRGNLEAGELVLADYEISLLSTRQLRQHGLKFAL